ncbi:MAG TPA: hypothetical protein VK668_16150 [Mucilaginibacter sp.]|nr:hypothetical protein [Mucilaginibacter sp.]
MKKAILILLACVLITAVNNTLYAQQVTKFGDNVGTLDGIIKAYYDAVCVKKGEKISYVRDSLLHIANVRVGLGGIDSTGSPVMHYISLKAYHKQSDAYMEKSGFYERETARTVQNIRNLYHVWSTYESRYEPGGKVIAQGINSIELYYDGKRFWILGWFYD